MDNETKLTTFNTFTFKSEAEMLLHINYWDDEGEKAFKILKTKGCTRFCYSRIWNKKGLFKTSVLFEYENAKAFNDCQIEIGKMMEKIKRDLKSIDVVVDASRNIVLKDIKYTIMISEKNQRKAIALLTLSAGDTDKLRELVDELEDAEAEEIIWYFGWLRKSVKKQHRKKKSA